MNKDNLKGLAVISLAVIILLSLGYFLSKNPPKVSPASADNMDSMHGQSSVAVDNKQLNSLVDKPMPDIQLVDKDGKLYTTENLKGKNTVLFFNEGLMCYPACWNQIAEFGSDVRFDSNQTQAFSVLVDSSKDWQRAIDKMPELAKSKTLFDVGASVSGTLGLLTLPSSMHRGSLPGHTYIVVDKNGIVRYVKDDPNMAIANDLLINEIAKFN